MFFFGHSNVNKRNRDVSLTPLRFQVVSVSEFLKLYEERSSEILSAKIIPPSLGDDDFGKVLVEWKNPVFVPSSEISEGAFA